MADFCAGILFSLRMIFIEIFFFGGISRHTRFDSWTMTWLKRKWLLRKDCCQWFRAHDHYWCKSFTDAYYYVYFYIVLIKFTLFYAMHTTIMKSMWKYTLESNGYNELTSGRENTRSISIVNFLFVSFNFSFDFFFSLKIMFGQIIFLVHKSDSTFSSISESVFLEVCAQPPKSNRMIVRLRWSGIVCDIMKRA